MADQIVLDRGIRSATTASRVFAFLKAKAYLILDVVGLSGTPTLTPKLQLFDELTGEYVTIASFSAVSPTAPTVYTYCLTDQSFAPTTVTDTAQCYLTDSMRVVIEHADTDLAEYLVSILEVNAA